MGKILLTLSLLISFLGANAKTYFSAMHGNWEDPSNWFEDKIGNPACEAPGPEDYVVIYHDIKANHDLLIGATGNLSLIGVGQLHSKFNLTILQGGRFENFAEVKVGHMLVSGMLMNLGRIKLQQLRIGGKLDNSGQIHCHETFNVDRSGYVYTRYGSLDVGPYRVAAEIIAGEAMISGVASAHNAIQYNRGMSPISCSVILRNGQ